MLRHYAEAAKEEAADGVMEDCADGKRFNMMTGKCVEDRGQPESMSDVFNNEMVGTSGGGACWD